MTDFLLSFVIALPITFIILACGQAVEDAVDRRALVRQRIERRLDESGRKP